MTEPTATPPRAPSPHPGHVIVCGVGHLGMQTISELRSRFETVVAIGPDDEPEEQLAAIHVRLVVGDGQSPRTLREADIATASAIVVTGDDDLANLNTALAATELRPSLRVVIRLFDQEVGAHIPELFSDATALSSSALAAPGFVSAALDGESGDRFPIAGQMLSTRRSSDPVGADRSIPLARLGADRTAELLPDLDVTGDLIVADITDASAAAHGSVTTARDAGSTSRPGRKPGSALAGVRARLSTPERRLFRFGAVLIGLAIASALYFDIVVGLTPINALSYAITLLTGAALPVDIGDAASLVPLRVYAIFLSLIGAALVAIVYAFITDALIRSRLLETLGRRTVPTSIHDHVIVAGLGSIGYRVALGIAARGVPVVVADVGEDGQFVSPTRAAKIPVVIGDARHREVLDGLRIDHARALVVATSDDLVNLAIALNARAIRPDLRVVVRLYDPDFAVRVQRGFAIRFTRSVSHLAAPAFAAAAIGSEVVAPVPIGDRRIILFARMRVPGDSALAGRLASTLDRVGAVRLLAVADPGSEAARWDIPTDEVLDPDEEIVVAATRQGLGDLLRLAATRGAVVDPDVTDTDPLPPPIIDRSEGEPTPEE